MVRRLSTALILLSCFAGSLCSLNFLITSGFYLLNASCYEDATFEIKNCDVVFHRQGEVNDCILLGKVGAVGVERSARSFFGWESFDVGYYSNLKGSVEIPVLFAPDLIGSTFLFRGSDLAIIHPRYKDVSVWHLAGVVIIFWMPLVLGFVWLAKSPAFRSWKIRDLFSPSQQTIVR